MKEGNQEAKRKVKKDEKWEGREWKGEWGKRQEGKIIEQERETGKVTKKGRERRGMGEGRAQGKQRMGSRR